MLLLQLSVIEIVWFTISNVKEYDYERFYCLGKDPDENNYVLMASVDLSSAFDVVNIKLLLKRLKIMGLPNELIKLIKEWLKDI